MTPTLLFAYGTLRTGFWNHRVYLEAALHRGLARAIGPGTTRSPLPLLLFGDRHIPGLVHLPGRGRRVRGEIFEVAAPVRRALHVVEGVADGFYSPAMIEVEGEDGERRRCEIFVVGPTPDPLSPERVLDDLPEPVAAAFARGEETFLSRYGPKEHAVYRPRPELHRSALAGILGVEDAVVDRISASSTPRDHPGIWRRIAVD